MNKLLVVLWVSVFTMISSVNAGSIPSEEWKKGKEAKEDSGNLMVSISDDSKVGDLISGLEKPLQLEPGIYTVSAKVKAAPLLNMGYRIILTVRDEAAKDLIRPWERTKWMQLTQRLKEQWVATDEARAFQHDENGMITLKATFAVTKKSNYQVSVGWKVGEYHWWYPKSKKLQASLDTLTLLKLDYTKLETDLLMGTLTADKVVYKSGMAPTLTVPIQYTGKTEQEITCRVKVSKDIDASIVVATEKITLKPFSTMDFSIKLPALEGFGGYRFDLQVMNGDKVVQSRERSAAVSNSFNRIGIWGTPQRDYIYINHSLKKEKIERAFASYRDSYISWWETGVAFNKCDFQGLAPEEDSWLTNIGWIMSKQPLKWINEIGKKNGVGTFAYVKAFTGDGWYGWQWAARNPDLVLYHSETGKALGRYDVKRFANHEKRKKELLEKNTGGSYWPYFYTDTTRPSIVDIHVRSTIKSMKMFGWTGVRFDGDFNIMLEQKNFDGPSRNLKGKIVATEKDSYYTWAASVQRYEKKMKKAFPDFEVGYNGGFGSGDLEREALVIPAQAAGGGMVMNEHIRGRHNEAHSKNRWKEFSEEIAHDSRRVRSFGGFYQIIGAYGMRADDYLYQAVYTLAAQAKPYGSYWFSTPFSVRLSRFVTRYAGIMCGDLYPVPSPDSRFEVKGSAELDWKNYVNFIDVSDKRRDYVINLINPPVPERANSDDARCLLRPPVKNIKISIDTDSYEKPIKAWLLDPWSDGKKQIKLTSRPGGAELELQDPVSIWSVVVIECELKE